MYHYFLSWLRCPIFAPKKNMPILHTFMLGMDGWVQCTTFNFRHTHKVWSEKYRFIWYIVSAITNEPFGVPCSYLQALIYLVIIHNIFQQSKDVELLNNLDSGVKKALWVLNMCLFPIPYKFSHNFMTDWKAYLFSFIFKFIEDIKIVEWQVICERQNWAFDEENSSGKVFICVEHFHSYFIHILSKRWTLKL